MASRFYDPYDSRPHPRHDSVTRPRDDGHLNPSHSRHANPRQRSPGGDTTCSTAHKYSYDSRYSYPPPPPITSHSIRDRRSPHRQRNSWPPAPIVENEVVSLAREAGSRELLKELARSEAPSRGLIDQEPIIEEVQEYINQHERRFVVVPSGNTSGRSSGGIPTPPTSEDEKGPRGRRKPYRLSTDLDHVAPELEGRTASPYAFSKPTSLRKDTSADVFLSPESMTPPASDQPNRFRPRLNTGSNSHPSSPRPQSTRVSPSARKGKDYFGAGDIPDESALEDVDAALLSSAVKPTQKERRQFSKSEETSKRPIRTSSVEFAAPQNAPARTKEVDSNRPIESSTTMPKSRTEKTYRPSPLMVSSAFSELGHVDVDPFAVPRNSTLSPHDHRRESGYSSRNISPASATSRASAPSPQRSPKFGAGGFPSDKHAGSGRNSQVSSVSNSRPSTPPTAATSTRMPRTELDWNTAMAEIAAAKSKPPTRLSDSVRMPPLPPAPPIDPPIPMLPIHANTFSYPLDYGPGTPTAFMPSERDYQFYPSNPTTPLVQPFPTPGYPLHAEPPVMPPASYASIRPTVIARHSLPIEPPVESRPLAPQRSDSNRIVGPSKQEADALLKRGLPGCPRVDAVAGYDDWYTLIGAPSLDFCPHCIDSVFDRTMYRNCFRKSVPRPLHTKIRCAFGTPWHRLAWLLTLQLRRPDLALMKDLADIDESSEVCPGVQEAVRSWYGLRDPQGLFVRDFQICYTDVRKIERLLPTLTGLFVRLPHRTSHDKRKCHLRTESNRFSVYLDAIIGMHDKASASRKLPNPMPFVELVERKLRIRECERDNMLLGGLWHYPTSIPAFTVCEDCFEEVVEPEIKKNSDVAMRFHRTVQPVYGEGIGTSCQLYSPRMRRVFKKAVRESDARYLARKAKDRREAELRLQEKFRDIMRVAAKRSDGGGIGGGGEEEERRLERELERISAEWKEKWE